MENTADRIAADVLDFLDRALDALTVEEAAEAVARVLVDVQRAADGLAADLRRKETTTR